MYDNKKTLKDINLDNKRVIVRFDFNVPIKNGNVTNDKRITAAIPTIKYLLDKKCKIIGLSHLSRIKSIDDIKSNKKSLKELSIYLTTSPLFSLESKKPNNKNLLLKGYASQNNFP